MGFSKHVNKGYIFVFFVFFLIQGNDIMLPLIVKLAN